MLPAILFFFQKKTILVVIRNKEYGEKKKNVIGIFHWGHTNGNGKHAKLKKRNLQIDESISTKLSVI